MNNQGSRSTHRSNNQHFGSLSAVVASVFVLFVYCAICFSSVGGSISGVVRDPSAAVVPQTVVRATNTDTHILYTTETDGAGFYSFPQLPIGHYDVEIRAVGFKEFVERNLLLNVNSVLQVDVVLELGSPTQSVTVSGAVMHVDTESTQIGEVIGSTKMTSLPLNGRSYTDLLTLQPGVVPGNSGWSPGGIVNAPSGGLDSGTLSINGESETANAYIVNGADVVEDVQNGASIIPNLDSIAEWRILTSNFDAEYGNFSGGQVNVVTKSGTNQFHGDAFEFARNTDLDARNFFSPQRGAFQQNQFGATFGGPLVRNKVFFFSDYQGTRQIIGVDSGDISVPSMEERQGDFSSLTGSVGGPGWAKVLSGELGYPVTAGEAYYTSGCTTSAQCVFPNGIIPKRAFSSPATPLMQYIPLPNVPGDYYSTSAFDQRLRDDKEGIRLDANTRWGMLSAYYFADDYHQNIPYPSGGANLPGFSGANQGRAQLVNLGDSKSLGPSALNEFHLNYVRNVSINGKMIGGAGVSPSSLGFVQGCSTPGICVFDPQYEAVPLTSFNNFTIGSIGPISIYENTYQATDNFSKIIGTHTIKLGGEFHADQVNESIYADNNAGFYFYGDETGVDFADFLIGAPSEYIQGVEEPAYSRSHYAGFYVQDSWRVTPKLTLNYGLRWDLSTPWAEEHGEQETLMPGEQSVVFPGAPRGWVFPGDPGIPSTISAIRYNDFSPRIGLAYAPNPSGGLWRRLLGEPGKSSIRAGFGKYFTQMGDWLTTQEIGAAPFGAFYVSPVPPDFAEPFVDRGTQNSEGQRFPVPFPPLNVSAKHPDNAVNWAQFLPISSSPGWYPGNVTPYSEQYEASFERQLAGNTLLSLSYVGSQGHHLVVNLPANPGIPGLCLSVSQPGQVMPGTPTCGASGEGGTYYPVTGGVINTTREWGSSFGSIDWADTMGNSSYNAMEASVRHTSGRLELLASYTYSKCLDQATEASEMVQPFSYASSRGLCGFDLTQHFVTSYNYKVPFDKAFRPNRLSQGWAVSGITSFGTGFPVTIADGHDQCLIGSAAGNYGHHCEPDYTPGPLLANTDPRSREAYFNTSLFNRAPLGQMGTSARRFFHGPGSNNWDMALLKDTAVTESKTLQFRAEFFNAFNHAQFGGPDGTINSGVFGLINGAAAPRIMQFALKLLF
jgi:hypothetical protein